MNKFEVLAQAADEIEKRGHAHDCYVNADGEVCALGAMRLVCGGVVEKANWAPSGLTVNLPRGGMYVGVSEARNHLFAYLRAHAEQYGIDLETDSIPEWNDRNDKDTVVAAMRAAIEWNE